jgi:hypothetical protein
MERKVFNKLHKNLKSLSVSLSFPLQRDYGSCEDSLKILRTVRSGFGDRRQTRLVSVLQRLQIRRGMGTECPIQRLDISRSETSLGISTFLGPSEERCWSTCEFSKHHTTNPRTPLRYLACNSLQDSQAIPVNRSSSGSSTSLFEDNQRQTGMEDNAQSGSIPKESSTRTISRSFSLQRTSISSGRSFSPAYQQGA